MFRNTARAGFLAVVLFILAVPAFAWDDTGHKISAYIAWQRMTPAVRERVLKILLAAPEDSHIGAFYMPYGLQNVEARKRDFFMFMATWADVVRDNKFDTRFKKYHKGNWHYSDKFWTSKDGKIEYLKAPEEGGQALARIAEYDKLIRSDASDTQKALAVAWLEHLIGDIHQPLHSSARVTDTEPEAVTVTLTAAEVVDAPTLSVATAVSEWVPVTGVGKEWAKGDELAVARRFAAA